MSGSSEVKAWNVIVPFSRPAQSRHIADGLLRQTHRPSDLVVARRELRAALPKVGGVQEEAEGRRRGRGEGGEGEVDEELPGGLCFFGFV